MREATHQELEGLIKQAADEKNRDARYWSKTPTLNHEKEVGLLNLASLLSANGYLPRILECYWNPIGRSDVLIESMGCSGKKETKEELKKQIEYSIFHGKYKITHVFFFEVLANEMFSRAERQELYRKCEASTNGDVYSYIQDLLQHDPSLAEISPYEARLRHSQDALIARQKRQLRATVQSNHEVQNAKRGPTTALVSDRCLKK